MQQASKKKHLSPHITEENYYRTCVMKRKLPGTVDVVRVVVLFVTTYLLNKIKTFIRTIEPRFIIDSLAYSDYFIV